MIRKRKSKITPEDEPDKVDLDVIKKNNSFSKQESISKGVKSLLDVETLQGVEKQYPIILEKDIEKAQSSADKYEILQTVEKAEEPMGENLNVFRSGRVSRIEIAKNEMEKENALKENEAEILDKIYQAYDEESKLLLENFHCLGFGELFKNPFNPVLSRNEKITRIFYLSGFCIFPFFGWIFAILYGSFCNEKKTNKKIISIKIISSIQVFICSVIIITLFFILTRKEPNLMYCDDYNVIHRMKVVPEATFNVVFFGPIGINDWMQSKLANIAENLGFNFYAIGFPNLLHHVAMSQRHKFLTYAFKCIKINPEKAILFSYQLESAINFTIPFFEDNKKVLGFFSFNKKFKKKTPMELDKKDVSIEYLTPKEMSFYDIYSSIALNICESSKKRRHYSIYYIVHNSFNRYHIRCTKTLVTDYSKVVNNFNYNTTGDDEKKGKHEESDFKEVIDDFYQFLAFVKDVISFKNLELYKKLLCKNILCEDKGAVCAF